MEAKINNSGTAIAALAAGTVVATTTAAANSSILGTNILGSSGATARKSTKTIAIIICATTGSATSTGFDPNGRFIKYRH